KTSILDQVADPARAMLAAYVRVQAAAPPSLVEAAMRDAGIGYPVILKPDIGCNGAGVRLIENFPALAAALPLYPQDVELVAQ
ncbi:hypothetical protein, partial [Staphylococcus aureus]